MPVDYARTYANHPAKAARKLRWVTLQLAAARAAGDQKTVDQWDDARGQLEALLAAWGRCRCCGRTLRDPQSVRAGIGPECRKEERVADNTKGNGAWLARQTGAGQPQLPGAVP